MIAEFCDQETYVESVAYKNIYFQENLEQNIQ